MHGISGFANFRQLSLSSQTVLLIEEILEGSIPTALDNSTINYFIGIKSVRAVDSAMYSASMVLNTFSV